MTAKEAYKELFDLQTEYYAAVETRKRHGLDGGRDECRAHALTIALQYLLFSAANPNRTEIDFTLDRH